MFKFRLEPVLKYRGRIVEKYQRELAGANNTLQQENDKLEAFRSTRKNYSEKYGYSLDKLTIEEMFLYANYFDRMIIEIEKQIQVAGKAHKKVDKKRVLLLESVKKKKIIEAVRKRALNEYKQKEKKKEMAFLDEVPMTRFKPGSMI